MDINIQSVSGIYKISSAIDATKFYIGSSRNMRKRLIHHRCNLKNQKHANIILQNYVNKYGLSAIKTEVLEYCNIEDLIEREQYYLDLLKPHFNIRIIAEGNMKIKLSQEHCYKISQANKGKKFSKEHCKRISESKKGVKKGKGKPCSEETKKKISMANKGRITSDETKRKLSITSTGRFHSRESIERARLKILGSKMTEEQKKKLSVAKQINVYQYDLNMVFIRKWDSMTKASKELNLNINCISQCCKGSIRRAGNFVFKKELIEIAKPLL